MRRIAAAVLAIVAAGGALAPAPSVSLGRSAVCGTWRKIPVPAEADATYPGGAGFVTDVEVVSPSRAWAISDEGYEVWNEAHVYRWRGERWEEMTFPSPESGGPNFDSWVLSDIEVVSRTEAWVVGHRIVATDGRTVSRPLVGRWDGSRWRLVSVGLPQVHGRLDGIAVDPRTGRPIAVGAWSPSGRPWPSGSDQAALALRWNGDAWRRIETPDPGRWSRYVDVVAAGRNLWAVGTARRTGGRARLFASRVLPGGWTSRWGPPGSYSAADAVSAREIWAVGAVAGRVHGHGIAARWDGRAWRLDHAFDRVHDLVDVTAPAPGRVWAGGSAWVRSSNAPEPFVVRRVGGAWSVDWTRDRPGRVSAIGGDRHDLWMFLTFPPVEFAEVWRFTSFHRC